jgi:hypothetical protein
MAGRKIGNDPITLVWTKGDKYESQSKSCIKIKDTIFKIKEVV